MNLNGQSYKAVVIGASLGGYEALLKLLSYLPLNFPIPIIVVLHRLRNNKSFLAGMFDSKVAIKVKEADEKEFIKPGTVYLAPINYHILIEKDLSIALDSSELVNYSRPSIDILFESAALALGNQVIGIVLTGANEDGSEGLRQIAKAGGLTIVQDPATATSPYMPQAAIRVCTVDHILPLEEIGLLLNQLKK